MHGNTAKEVKGRRDSQHGEAGQSGHSAFVVSFIRILWSLLGRTPNTPGQRMRVISGGVYLPVESILAKFQDHDPRVPSTTTDTRAEEEHRRLFSCCCCRCSLGTETERNDYPRNSTHCQRVTGESVHQQYRSSDQHLKVNSESRSGHYNNKIIFPTSGR